MLGWLAIIHGSFWKRNRGSPCRQGDWFGWKLEKKKLRVETWRDIRIHHQFHNFDVSKNLIWVNDWCLSLPDWFFHKYAYIWKSTFTCICIYIYTYVWINLSFDNISIYRYIYICMYVCVMYGYVQYRWFHRSPDGQILNFITWSDSTFTHWSRILHSVILENTCRGH